MKKQLKRFGRIVFLSGAMLFLGCQTEDDFTHEEHSENPSGITIERKSFKDFKRLPQLTKDVYRNKQRLQGRGGELDTLYNFVIDSSTVRAMTKGNDTYYTMSITRGEANQDYFENLVVSEEPEGNRAFLIKYYPDDSYRERRAFHELAAFTGRMSAQEIDYDAISNKGGSDCTDVTFAYCGNGGIAFPAGPGCCNNSDGGAHIRYGTMRVCVDQDLTIDDPSGGSQGGGTTAPGGPSTGGSTGSTGSSGTGSPGTGSSGTAGGNTGGGISVPPTYPGTSNPIGGGGSGGSTNGGGTAPDPGSPDPGNPYDGSQDYGGGTGGPNPGNGGGKKPIITGPVYIPPATNTLFTFEFYLSTAQRSWLNQHSVQQGLVYGFVAANHYNQPSLDFAYPAIDALMEGGEVDFTYRIIKDDSFKNNPCLNSVYAQLGNAGTFQNYLKNFDGSFSVANLKLSASSSLDNSINAETTPPTNYLITISFNTNKLNRPALSIARTFMHELIHAEIFRKLLSAAGQPNLNYNNYTDEQWKNYVITLKNNYPGLYDYYMRWSWNIPHGQNPSEAQHELMAQHYRNIIKNALKEYDNNSQPESVYDALAWEGLKGTAAWNNLSAASKANINQIISTFENSNSNCN